jgi:hypothetical protein
MNRTRQVSIDLTGDEIAQIEEVLLRHRRTPLIIGLQKKMRDARRSLENKKEGV